jgi:hypothetical protein
MTAAYDWTTSDTVSMVIKCAESIPQGDSHLSYVVRVVSGDGATIRGIVGALLATSTEYPTSLATIATRIHNARTDGASNFSSQVGDRIIIEIGHHGVTPDTGATVYHNFGDPSATADYALTAGLTTDLCPWVELSRTVTFAALTTEETASAQKTLSIGIANAAIEESTLQILASRSVSLLAQLAWEQSQGLSTAKTIQQVEQLVAENPIQTDLSLLVSTLHQLIGENRVDLEAQQGVFIQSEFTAEDAISLAYQQAISNIAELIAGNSQDLSYSQALTILEEVIPSGPGETEEAISLSAQQVASLFAWVVTDTILTMETVRAVTISSSLVIEERLYNPH